MDVIVLDTNFVAKQQIDRYYSLIWTERYNSYGDFQLELPASKEAVDLLKEGYYLLLAGDQTSDAAMIIENIKIKTDIENGDSLIVSGRSLESILERRIVWEQTSLNGNLQNQVKKLINDSFINPSDPLRRVPNFIFSDSTDPSVTGLSLTAQYTGDTIYDAISDICISNGLGFKIILDSNNNFVFSLFNGKDRSYDQSVNPFVIFSPSYNNLMNTNYIQSGKLIKTIALILGEGEGAERKRTTAVSKTGTESGLARRELYVDARDISSITEGGQEISSSDYLNKLEQRGKERLSEYNYEMLFDGQIEPFITFKYNEDFFIGDILQISNEYGIDRKVRVIEYVRSQSDDGLNIYPTFSLIE